MLKLWQSQPVKSILTFCLILFPVIAFLLFFNKYAVNIPHWDDFAVRNSIAQILQVDSFLEKVKILFSQHNEHRIFTTRIAALIIYLIQGTINVKSLMFLGICPLIGISILFYKISKKYNLSLIYFAPITFLIFNNSLYENTFWGMASIQNFGAIFLAFLCFYWLVFSIDKQSHIYFYWAIVVCFFGVFTSSNGILIPVIGCLILLFQRRKREFFIWFSASFAFLLAFFLGFERNPDNVVKANIADLKTLVKGLFATIGNSIDSTFISPEKHLDLSMVSGIFLFIFIVLFAYQAIFKKYNSKDISNSINFINDKNNDLFLLACLAFLGITCGGIVFARISYGIGTLLTSKYKIYSLLIIVIFYIVASKSFSKKNSYNFIANAILLSVFFNLYSYFADYQNIRYLNQERICDQFKQQHSDKSFPNGGIMAKLQVPENAFYDDIINKFAEVKDSTQLKIIITEKENSLIFEAQKHDFNLNLSSAEAGLYFILKSADKIYLFPTQINASGKKSYLSRDFLLNNRLKIDNFVADISKFCINSGKYIVGEVLVENNSKTITWSNQTIDIQTITKDKPQQNW